MVGSFPIARVLKKLRWKERKRNGILSKAITYCAGCRGSLMYC